MTQTCQCPIIPGMCPFVFLAAFVQSHRVNCYEVTNEGIDLTARTSIWALRCEPFRALGLLLTDWGCQCALIRPHCAAGRCVSPAKLVGGILYSPFPRPVTSCRRRRSPDLSPTGSLPSTYLNQGQCRGKYCREISWYYLLTNLKYINWYHEDLMAIWRMPILWKRISLFWYNSNFVINP